MAGLASSTLLMLHLGLGSFHRAHQAVYMQGLIDRGDSRWALTSGNIRPDMPEVLAQLRSQGGAYTLETARPDGTRQYSRIASIRHVVPWDADLSAFVALGSNPSTRIISFTVTEAGYFLDADERLDIAAPEIVTDLAAARQGRAGTTLYGALTALLRERLRLGGAPVTLLCCDNLRHNGRRSRGGLLQFLDLVGDAALTRWVQASTSSPNTMVDRITPRPTAEVRARVEAETGVADPCALMAESFIQWVIEDDFINGRPAWESAGVQMVPSVEPYEEAKIRLLNATHSCIAWAGTLAGYNYIHEGVRDPRIHRLAWDYATEDAIPVLSPSPIDLPAYRDAVLERFGNAAIRDTNQRVAMDSFAKLPAFIVPTIRDRLARDERIDAVAMLPALFLALLQRWHDGTLAYPYQDQAMQAEAAHAICLDSDPVAALAASNALWGDLAGDGRLVAALRRAKDRTAQMLGPY